jgi:ribosomal-protein-alanine N-acetyltransferase
VAGVSTLDALRAGAGPDGYAVIDARRGEVFAAGPDLAPAVLRPADLADLLPPARWPSATARSATPTCCAESEVPPAGDRATPRAPATTPRWPPRAATPRPPSRATCAGPTPSRRPRDEIRRLALRTCRPSSGSSGRSYPTPWSRTMFAASSEKPTSRCYWRVRRRHPAAYLIVARYVDAWHIMNVAVDPDARRRGVAQAMLEHLFEDTSDDGTRGYTLEVRVSNAEAYPAVRAAGLRLDWESGAATTRTTARTP